MALPDDTPAPAFQWGANGARMTPEEIAAQRKVAAALAEKSGDYSPVRSVWQGVARAAQGIVGGYEAGQVDRAAKANADDNVKMRADLASYFGGGTAAPASVATQGTVPAAVAVAPPAPAAATPAVDTTGKIYSNDEPSPMDAPSGQDRINMIATALGEQPAGSPAGLGAINTIRNRAVDGGYGGDTPTAVVTAPKQYSSMNDPANRAALLARATANSPEVAKVSDAIDQAYGVGKYVNAGPNDPTEGKTHFYDPASMVPPNSVPVWARGKEYQTIGSTRFYDDPDEPAAKPVQVASASPTVAQIAAAVAPYEPEANPGLAHVMMDAGGPNDSAAFAPAAAPSPGVAAVTAAASGAPAPAAAPVAAPAAPTPGVGKVSQAVLQAYTSPYADPQTKALAGMILQKQMAGKAGAAYKDADGNLLQAGPDGLLHRVVPADSQTPAQKDFEYAATHPGFKATQKARDAADESPDQVKSLTPGGELYHMQDGKVVVDHKNDKGVNAEEVPQATIDFLADRVRMGDPAVKIGYARNPGVIAKIDSTAQQREDAGIPVSDAARSVVNNKVTLSARGSAERKLGTINTNNEFYGNNALGALDIAEKASADVPRTDYPGVNKALNAYRTQTGDPKTVALGAALNTVVNDYAKFTGGGVGTDSLRGHAEEILNGAHSPDQLAAIVHMMRLEIKRGQQSPSMVREGFDNLYAPHGSAGAPAPAAAVPPAAVPAPAVAKLAQNPTPEMKAHFDEVFGAGAAERALAGGK